jgi:hypothetical protein
VTPQAEYFFSGCKNPVNVSNLVIALASGNVIKVDRLPAEVLPHVVLLATVGLRSYQQQIIDDYGFLLQRMTDAITTADVALRLEDGERIAWTPNLSYAINIASYGPRGEYDMDTNPELDYIFKVYEELINADSDNLFAWLGSASEQQGAQRQDNGHEKVSQKKAERPTKKRGKK